MMKTRLLPIAPNQIKIEKINHMIPRQPVHQIPQNPPENQSQRDLSPQAVNLEMVPGQKQDHQRCQRHAREERIVSAEQTPRRTSVMPMNKLEKAWNHVPIIPVFQMPEHHQFGQLVERKHRQRQISNAPI